MLTRVLNSVPTSSSSPARFGWDAEKLSPFLLALLIAYAAIRSIYQAASRPFWFDEICTIIVTRQQTIPAMWSALQHGADGQPLGFYLVERLASRLVANQEIAFRIPSIAGFLVTIVCLFVLIRREHGGAVALFCASIPLVTILYSFYAIEARPYSLLVACIAFAVLCYQRAPAIRWTVLLGFSLALAQCLNYYAVLCFVPFVLAELASLLAERKVRWGVWMALACGCLPLAASWPFLSLLQRIYGQHFWAQPSLLLAEESYGHYFNQDFSTGKILVGTAAVAVLCKMLFEQRRTAGSERPTHTAIHKPIIILMILALPFIGYFAAILGHGGMTARYMLPTVLGFPLALGYTLPPLGRKSGTLVLGATLVFLAVFLGPQKEPFWPLDRSSAPFSSPADLVQNLVKSASHDDLPVVVSDPHDFLQIAQYASPELGERLVSVIDPPESVVYVGNDTADKQLAILRSYAPLQIYDFQSFTAEHPVFLLYSGSGGLGLDWWPRRLQQDGYTLRSVAFRPISEHDYLHRVMLVSRTKDSD